MANINAVGQKRKDALFKLLFATKACQKYCAEQNEKGHSIAKIAEDLGVSETTVRQWLKAEQRRTSV